jgi:NAD(P)-dependent dehydrogenase (short-subunit alcohol dehydrogenase family)
MDELLAGRTIVITGVSSGIGRAIATACAQRGGRVIGFDIDETGGREVAESIVGSGGAAEFRRVDVGVPEQIEAAFAGLNSVADGLVNCAAAFVGSSESSAAVAVRVEDLAVTEWRRHLETSLTGSFVCCQQLAKQLIRARRPGSIVNISSIAGSAALGRGNLPYSVAKAGMNQMTRELSIEWGRFGIRVNTIAPGHIATPRLQRIQREDPALTEKMLANALRAIPLGHFGRPADIADGAIFLLSDCARHITGVNLPIDGGSLGIHASANPQN